MEQNLRMNLKNFYVLKLFLIIKSRGKIMKIDIITTDTIALEHYIPARIEKEQKVLFKRKQDCSYMYVLLLLIII